MRRTAIVLLLLAACSGQGQEPANNLVEQGDGNIAKPAAPPAENVPAPLPGNAYSPTAQPAPSPPPDEKSALGAARRLQDYCDAVATRRFADAFAYWGNGGQDSGQTFAQFRDSFAKYAAYDCDIGNPGDMEGAAGSSYVTIPLKVTGVLAKGGGFVLEGPMTLRRVNDIDGSTAEQRRWHIVSSGLKPRP